ncbi:hypothetical protein FHS23_000394 [Prauserella isguenensis]|uniref:Uncharacterized protein n=1 Tax=Prauserella isguenensis TaxID=1470180 RepID=A0A839RXP4_9PSEU|nr:hypothetical protein [Prauserella isguenensis]MBB3049399.1 hypothetical protein [Prauserella isguenensis]
MSRTDKTQPFRVRLWDGSLRGVAVHDHRDGVCDLPGTLKEDLKHVAGNGGSVARGSCFWDLRYTGTRPCCCPLCRASDRFRADRRASRQRSRRELADLLKLAKHDPWGLD